MVRVTMRYIIFMYASIIAFILAFPAWGADPYLYFVEAAAIVIVFGTLYLLSWWQKG
jgi:hypothetical protein